MFYMILWPLVAIGAIICIGINLFVFAECAGLARITHSREYTQQYEWLSDGASNHFDYLR